MANIGISLPNIGANATYSYRDTGGAWESERTMLSGFGKPDSNFSLNAPCDEFRVIATYTTATDFDRFLIATMNITSGLSFSIQFDSDTPITFSQTTESNPRRRQSQIYRFGSIQNATTVTVIVTGIGQNIFSFGQLCLGLFSFSPATNIQNDSELGTTKTYTSQQTGQGWIQRLDKSAREYNCNFLKLSNAEFNTLQTLIDVMVNYGFVMFELDQSSNDLDNHFMCYSSLVKGEQINNDYTKAELVILEAYARD